MRGSDTTLYQKNHCLFGWDIASDAKAIETIEISLDQVDIAMCAHLPRFAVLAIVTFLAAGCSDEPGYVYGAPESPAVLTRPIQGGLIGAEFGGRYGTVASAAPARTTLGAMLPGNPGRGLNSMDLVFAEEAGQKAINAPIGQTVIWSNPQTGNSGSITPVREGPSTIGSECRQLHNLTKIDGQISETYGTACLDTGGVWRITN